MFRILTLNVNGIRSAGTKGLFKWLPKADADVVCLQEVKAHEADIPEAWRFPDDLHGHFHCAQKKGYSGTALYSKKEPLRVATGFGVPEFDGEGRCVQAEFRNVTVVSVYFPSGSSGPHRQESKYRFLDVFFPHLDRFRALTAEFGESRTRPVLLSTTALEARHVKRCDAYEIGAISGPILLDLINRSLHDEPDALLRGLLTVSRGAPHAGA